MGYNQALEQMMRSMAIHMGVDMTTFPTLPPYPSNVDGGIPEVMMRIKSDPLAKGQRD